MLREKLYNKSVSILVDAYMNDTLEKKDCWKCAIGNLIAGNNHFTIVNGTQFMGSMWINKKGEEVVPMWDEIHCIGIMDVPEKDWKNSKEAFKQILSTGYTPHETCKIEKAFEESELGETDDEIMFNGLMAVIDVLDEIHENKDEVVTAESKKKFIKELL